MTQLNATGGMVNSRPIVGRATVIDDAMNGGRNAARMETRMTLFLLERVSRGQVPVEVFNDGVWNRDAEDRNENAPGQAGASLPSPFSRRGLCLGYRFGRADARAPQSVHLPASMM
jgi:hypothetical protein